MKMGLPPNDHSQISQLAVSLDNEIFIPMYGNNFYRINMQRLKGDIQDPFRDAIDLNDIFDKESVKFVGTAFVKISG
jgi:hypothetical protein